jgi:hypothetical protein
MIAQAEANTVAASLRNYRPELIAVKQDTSGFVVGEVAFLKRFPFT